MTIVDKQGIIIIIASILITLLFIICIKYIKCYKSKPNDFNQISKVLNNNILDNEKTRLI